MQSELLVTTARHPSAKETQVAQQIARQLGGRFVERRNHDTISNLQNKTGANQVLAIGERFILHVAGQEIFFHPSMAVVRVKRLLAGNTDTMIEKSGILPGDHVLDCTLGMGADAIVFSHVVGPEGKVVGIEQSPILALLVRYGLKNWPTPIPALAAAMRRIDVVSQNHLEYMQQLPDRSVDVVYFDPMFRTTIQESVNFDPIRALSIPNALSPEAVHEARRIARKSIVLKERLNSGEFERLGFPRPDRRSSSFTYSVIQVSKE